MHGRASPKPVRIRDAKHLKMVRHYDCWACAVEQLARGRSTVWVGGVQELSEAHHTKLDAEDHTMNKKPSDHKVVPLCSNHHKHLHDVVGDEGRFWLDISPRGASGYLWNMTPEQKAVVGRWRG